MTRRDANWLILRASSVAGAAEFFVPWSRAAQSAHNHSAPPDPHDWNTYRPKFFSAAEMQTLDLFTAILIPTDETPGAHEAQVASFIDFVVNAAAEFAPEVQTQWRAAVEWLGKAGFNRLSSGEQARLVEEISAPEHDPSQKHAGFPAYRLIKEMTIRAFYSSRVGLVDALEYKGLAYLTEFPGCNHPEHHQV